LGVGEGVSRLAVEVGEAVAVGSPGRIKISVGIDSISPVAVKSGASAAG
jgi:hypothetical protein